MNLKANEQALRRYTTYNIQLCSPHHLLCDYQVQWIRCFRSLILFRKFDDLIIQVLDISYSAVLFLEAGKVLEGIFDPSFFRDQHF